jgi:alginate O-acetyltransferase complex protein AlgI
MAKRENTRDRGIFLALSVVCNLGMLGYFKYSGFLSESINGLLDTFRLGTPLSVPDILLPAGISFYTFQTLSYSVDIYRGEIKPARSLMAFAAYVSMFPQLIAGPIVRYSDVELQMRNLPQTPEWANVSKGIWLFVIGMSQKILIADTVSNATSPLLSDMGSLQFFGGWCALLGYTIQLYFDFAGYSNMAIGLGLFFGFHFPQNFDSPYKSSNIQMFWRRWHMSLSTFLRDYLYIPLGGNRYGKILAWRNLLIVMLLGGIWHGAGWTFVLWGLLHGCLLVGFAMTPDSIKNRIPRRLGVCLTLFCVMFGWLLFRSTNLAMAYEWSLAIFGGHGIESNAMAILTSPMFLFPSIGLLFCWLAPNAEKAMPAWTPAVAVFLAVMLSICILRFDAESPFLYFQF